VYGSRIGANSPTGILVWILPGSRPAGAGIGDDDLAAVQRYLCGLVGYTEVAQACGIDRSMLRRWVAHYQLHGRAGLCSEPKRYTAQFKVEVLSRIRQESLSDRQAVALYNLGDAGSLVAGAVSMMKAHWSPDVEVERPCRTNIRPS